VGCDPRRGKVGGLVHLAACVSGRGSSGTRDKAAPQSQAWLQMVLSGLVPADFLRAHTCRGVHSLRSLSAAVRR